MNETLYILTTSDSIGNSLSSINQNYLVLDNLLTNIQLSATNYWIPVANYYEQRKDYWKTAARKIKDNFPLWQIASTNFESNSARWITPITTWYPCIVDYSIVADRPDQFEQLLKNWANFRHPILTNKSPIPNYLEGQLLIVYCFNYEQDIPTNQTYSLIDTTTCVTNDTSVCAYCARCYSGGGGPCGISCSGCTHCSSCTTQTCYFYKGFPSTKTKKSTIQADLNIKYTNKYESTTINAAAFIVERCQWTFKSFLTLR
jgi:hypothetical protein